MNIYKETYLWMSDGIGILTNGLKKEIKEDLEKYYKTVDPKDMKKIKTKGGKVKKFDAYEMAKEEELPKPYSENEWAD